MLARRQPGSVFKPFVYAAAFDDAVDGVNPIITPATTVVDEPTTFDFDGKEYTPNNYGENFHGTVTAREALTLSLNVATVKVAEMVGYGRVVQVARQMGLENDIQATPAVALGAYEMTPLEVAGGIHGVRQRRHPGRAAIHRSGGQRAEARRSSAARSRTQPVLDPRVAYQVTSVLEDVMNRGTGASVRARGFKGPAAGKTGTSRDGWFAGYTSNLLCIVWVGFDDNRDLNVSGTVLGGADLGRVHEARDGASGVSRPAGIRRARGRHRSGDRSRRRMQLATPACPMKRTEVFIAGTEPTEYCQLHGGRLTQSSNGSWLSRLLGGREEEPPASATGSPVDGRAASNGQPSGSGPASRTAGNEPPASDTDNPPETENKNGLLHRIFGIFGGSKPDPDSPKTKPPSE